MIVEETLDAETRLFIPPEISAGWIWSSTSGMMFRRASLDIIRPAHPERLRICADRYLANGSHMLGGTVRIERSLGCYRLHGGNEFSRNTLLGGRSSLGRPPRELVSAMNEALIACLCDRAQQLRATLPPTQVADYLIRRAGKAGAFALAASNPGARLIMSAVPPARRVSLRKKIKRWIKGWLRPRADRPEPRR
jgi:hypothetical protein